MTDDPDQRRGLGPLGHTMISAEPTTHTGRFATMINHAAADTLARVRAVRDEWADVDADDASVLELWEALDRALADQPGPAETGPTMLEVLKRAEETGDIIPLTGPRSVTSPGGVRR